MAGHIQDRWYKTETGPDGKPVKVKTDRYGAGMRYRARYIGPDGIEKSKSFPDRQKRLAEQWLTDIASDMSRGRYIDPRAARITFKSYAEKWLKTHGIDPASQVVVEQRLRLHAFRLIGSRPLELVPPGAHSCAGERAGERSGRERRLCEEHLRRRTGRPQCGGRRRAVAP
ncbi:hypothetical protein SALBM217S_03009 [Streptomyces griseoloalbus]